MKFFAVFATIVAVAIARPNVVPELPSPSPVVVGPIAPGSSPLVQLIINVNNEQQVADVITPMPVLPGLVSETRYVHEVPVTGIDPYPYERNPDYDLPPIVVVPEKQN